VLKISSSSALICSSMVAIYCPLNQPRTARFAIGLKVFLVS